jgi:Zn-dependent protease
MDNSIYNILISIIPLIFAITIHEVSHGYIARKLGDPTAFSLGRLTLNPIKHIDILGTLIVPIISFLFIGVTFGWAKPVPINFNNLKNYRRDSLLVALVGPLSNLLMAFFWSFIVFLFIFLKNYIHLPLIEGMQYMGLNGIIINLSFMLFNLIPILPLDGGRICNSLLPRKFSYYFEQIEPYGLYIVMFLTFTGLISKIIVPILLSIYPYFFFYLHLHA